MRGSWSRGPTTTRRSAPRCLASVASIAPLRGSAGTVRASTPLSCALVVAGEMRVRPATASRLLSTSADESGPMTAWACGMAASVRAKIRPPALPESPGRRTTSTPSTPPAALASSTARLTAACVAGPYAANEPVSGSVVPRVRAVASRDDGTSGDATTVVAPPSPRTTQVIAVRAVMTGRGRCTIRW